jgi:glucose/arabinose dehydrogenase/peptidoglycan/xylan/chitin deacetylase (PgdA/CDA1 family)
MIENSCYCVAFKLEDIEDGEYVTENAYVPAQIEVMELFKNKNASLTIGIIGNSLSRNGTLVDYIQNRINSSQSGDNSAPISLANHGWEHEDFASLPKANQSLLMKKTNDKIFDLFGTTPLTFIPPLNSANNDTLVAMVENFMTFFSSTLERDPMPYSGEPNGTIYHIPQTAETAEYNDTDKNWHGLPYEETLKEIQSSIRDHGYSVVRMNPDEFSMQTPPGNNQINQTMIDNLNLLIDKLRSMRIRIVLLEQIPNYFAPMSELIPEIGLSDFGGRGKYSAPEFEWGPLPVAPTDLTFLDSDKLGSQYENDLFVADVNLGNIYHFDLDRNRTGLVLKGPLADHSPDTSTEMEEIIFARGLGGITDLEVSPDGYLYILSRVQKAIFRIVPQQDYTLGNSSAASETNTTSSQVATVTDPNLRIEPVAKGLDFPTSMALLGPDDILVLEKESGIIKRIVNGTILPEPVLDVNVAIQEGRGMLGIALAKSENNTYAFTYYTESGGQKDGDDLEGIEPAGNRLYRYEWQDGKLVNPKLLLDLPASTMKKDGLPAHIGGKVAIAPDQSVYVVIGDVGAIAAGHKTLAQNVNQGPPPDGTSGILRVNWDGETVGRGILGDGHPLDKYYAYGIRNSFGIAFDPVTGKLWDTENGPEFGDEINLVEPGFNSGYLVVQGNRLLVASTANEERGDSVAEMALANLAIIMQNLLVEWEEWQQNTD